jgi:cell division protein FtsQ
VSRVSRTARDRAAATIPRPRSAPPVESNRSRDEPDARAPRDRRFRVVRFAMVTVLLLATLAVAGDWVLRQSYFRVQHITFVGVRHEPLALVIAASGLEAHPTMLDVNAATVKANLSQFAWIDAVHLTKHWPNTVVVTVHESTAVAVAFNAKHVLQYVDRRGRDLGAAPLHVNLPTLHYVHPRSALWPYARAGRSAAYVAAQLPPAFSAQVSLITANDHGVVTLEMTTPVTFILGPPTQLHAKFVAIASVIAHSTLHPGEVVDVTVPGELAVTGASAS